MDCSKLFYPTGQALICRSKMEALTLEDQFDPVTATSLDGSKIGFGIGRYLLLGNLSASATFAESTSELEFQQIVVAIVWDPLNRCLIVADKIDTLHFVSVEGNLLFSYPLQSSELYNIF